MSHLHVLEPEEVADLMLKLSKCQAGTRDRLAACLMWQCGLRISEVCNLHLTDVRWNTGVLHIREAKGRKDRNVFITGTLDPYLTEWLVERPDVATPWLLTTIRRGKEGKRVSERALRRVITRTAQRAKLPVHVYPHLLRHTAATEMLESGFTLFEVKDTLGHSSVATTSKYLHTRPAVLAAKMAAR